MGSAKRPEDSAANALTIPDHQMLRRIGDGSYGEVWLARSATGALRAVKLVRRDAFDNDKPFEREFNGLLYFEPLSRGHEGLVDILQVGRSSAGDSFYCIMELADDAANGGNPKSETRNPKSDPEASRIQKPASGIPEPESYTPLTLDVLIRQNGGRLPMKACLAIASTLASALQYLHNAGLVHRDIKPSNIIFVGGVPKLADVGLVARADSARTFVGTEGFLPPEGPGTPQADIYSLGKCLYEMAMGKDRQSFPSPPTMLDEFPDRQELLELNEVITKACEPEPVRRYRTAAQMAADLQIIATGQSLQQARRRKRLRRSACVASILAILALLGWFVPSALRGPRLELVREFSLPGSYPAVTAKLGNFDASPDLELFNASHGHLSVVSLDGTVLQQRAPAGLDPELTELSLVADLNGDGLDEMFVSWRADTNLHISVFNQWLYETARFNAIGGMATGKAEPYPDSSLVSAALLKKSYEWPRALRGVFASATETPLRLNGVPDESPALLAYVFTEYSLARRSVLLFNATNGDSMWEAAFPGNPHGSIVIVPRPENGPLFVVGTFASNNGAGSGESFNDAHSYLYALSAQGERLWAVETGPEHSCTQAHLLVSRGTNHIVAMVWRNYLCMLAARKIGAEEWSPSLRKFDLEGREVARFTSDQPLVSMKAVDLDGRGDPVVFAARGDGSLLLLNSDLRRLRQVSVVPQLADWVDLQIVDVLDLDGDGRREVVLSASQFEVISYTNMGRHEGEANQIRLSQNSVIVLDQNLRPLARRTIHHGEKQPDFEVLVAPNPSTGGADILALDQRVTVLQFKRR